MEETASEYFQQPFPNPLSDYCWCTKCERVYKSVSWFHKEWYCPNLNCNASLFDLKDWEEFPYYPEHPKEGTYFPVGGWPSNTPPA